MFTAARKVPKKGTDSRDDVAITPIGLSAGLIQKCQQEFGKISEAISRLGQDVAQAVARGVPYPPPSKSLFRQCAPLASISGATSPNSSDTTAILPNKDRAVKSNKGPVLAKGIGAGSLDGKVPASATKEANDSGDPNKEEAGEEEERILISEVDVSGADGGLRDVVLQALTTRPNFAYTVREVQEDMQRVFDTGYFSTCRPRAEDTRDGVRLTIEVSPNPALRGVVATGAARLPQAIIQDAFKGMRGRTLNFNELTTAVARLNAWYEQHGVLGQVIDVTMGAGDIAALKVAEATVNRISLRYADSKTGEVREEGRTKPDVILRQVTTRPGQAYDLSQAKTDIEAVYSMGLFEDVSIRPAPAEGSTVEAPRVDLTLEVKERKKTGGLAAGGGISAAGASEGALPGFVGTVSYSQRNLFGLGQRLVASAEVGQLDSTFRVSHTEPWVRGDAFRTSRTISAQNTKTSAAPVHGRAADEAEPSSTAGVG